MVVKVYISTISGNMDIKKKQESIKRILESRGITYEEVDISDSSNEEAKLYMRKTCPVVGNQTVPLPPQLFNEQEYCGDYEGLEAANEVGDLDVFLKLASEKGVSQTSVTLTSDVTEKSRGGSVETDEGADSEDAGDELDGTQDTPEADGPFCDD